MLLGLIFPCACKALILILGVRNYRYYVIKRQSAKWPVAEATIEKGEESFWLFLRGGAHSLYRLLCGRPQYRCCIGRRLGHARETKWKKLHCSIRPPTP